MNIKTKKPVSSEPPAATGTMIIDNLATAKLLADPLKLKILQHFVDQPRTTKQVADLMGEKPTKLYRHVDSLVEHQLLNCVREQPKRGTVERYLQAVAVRFQMDDRLFAPDNDDIAEAHATVRQFWRQTEDQLINALGIYSDENATELTASLADLEPIILGIAVKASRDQLLDLRKRLVDWVDSCNELAVPEDAKDLIDCRGMVAFYPLSEEQR